MNLNRRTEPTIREKLEFAPQAPCDIALKLSCGREAWHEYPETLVPDIQLYRIGEGSFAGDSGKIKQARFLPAA